MDSRLHDRLSRWHEQIEHLEGVERFYLDMEANEDPMWSQFYLQAEGKTAAEREALAYTNPEWRVFQKGLIEARVSYKKELRLLELKQSAFQSDYLAAKREAEAIQKLPKSL